MLQLNRGAILWICFSCHLKNCFVDSENEFAPYLTPYTLVVPINWVLGYALTYIPASRSKNIHFTPYMGYMYVGTGLAGVSEYFAFVYSLPKASGEGQRMTELLLPLPLFAGHHEGCHITTPLEQGRLVNQRSLESEWLFMLLLGAVYAPCLTQDCAKSNPQQG